MFTVKAYPHSCRAKHFDVGVEIVEALAFSLNAKGDELTIHGDEQGRAVRSFKVGYPGYQRVLAENAAGRTVENINVPDQGDEHEAAA